MSLTMHCEPCGKCFTGPASYNQHIESYKHIRKVSNLNALSNTNGKEVLNTSETLQSSLEHSSNQFECSCCSLKFDSFVNYQTHSLSAEHAKRILENEMPAESVKNMVSQIKGDAAHSDIVKNNSNAVSDKNDTILPEVEMMKSQASFSFCDTCKKSFSGPDPYKQHIESAGHIKKIELEKKISLGIMIGTEFSCAPCKKTFSGIAPYNQHMNSEIHKKKIKSLELFEKFALASNVNINKIVLEPGPSNKESNPWYCKTCDIICSGPAPFEQHNKGSIHLKNFLKAQREKSCNGVLCNSPQIDGRPNMPFEDMLPGLMDNNKDARIVKLDESITVFLPEEEINFDEINKECHLNSAEPSEDVENNKTNLKTAETDEEVNSDDHNIKTNLNSAEGNGEIDSEQHNNNDYKLAEKNSKESELIQILSCSLTMREN